VERFGHRCLPIVADVTSAEAREEMLQTAIDQFQQIDILVNAAAVGWPGEDPAQAPQGRSFLASSPTDWADVTTVNLDTTAAMIHLVGDQMIHLGGGKIINITPAAGHHASDGYSAYGASKAAIEQLTRTLAHELGPHGIHINCIAPGRIVTMEQEQGAYWTAGRRAAVGESIAIGRVGEDQDIGPLAIYLASEASDFVTGATFTLDGGGYVLAPAETAP
jgi:NAD(P)-dependent dehydrogenase (short-subunit alcohol dehydrogenase family)